MSQKQEVEDEYALQSKLVYNQMKEYEQYWQLPDQPRIFTLVSLVISQKIPIGVSQRIRKKIFQHFGSNQITLKDLISITEEQWKVFGLEDSTKVKTIQQILSWNDETPSLAKLETMRGNGVNAWTIKGYKLWNKIEEVKDEDFFLEEDSYVRENLSNIFGLKNIVNEKTAKEFVDTHWRYSKCDLSQFLWRLRKTSAVSLGKGIELKGENDFLQLFKPGPFIL